MDDTNDNPKRNAISRLAVSTFLGGGIGALGGAALTETPIMLVNFFSKQENPFEKATSKLIFGGALIGTAVGAIVEAKSLYNEHQAAKASSWAEREATKQSLAKTNNTPVK